MNRDNDKYVYENGKIVGIRIKKENITFAGDTENERKANELIWDLSMENDYLQQTVKKLKEHNRAITKGLNKVMIKRKKWKERYYKLRRKYR